MNKSDRPGIIIISMLVMITAVLLVVALWPEELKGFERYICVETGYMKQVKIYGNESKKETIEKSIYANLLEEYGLEGGGKDWRLLDKSDRAEGVHEFRLVEYLVQVMRLRMGITRKEGVTQKEKIEIVRGFKEVFKTQDIQTIKDYNKNTFGGMPVESWDDIE